MCKHIRTIIGSNALLNPLLPCSIAPLIATRILERVTCIGNLEYIDTPSNIVTLDDVMERFFWKQEEKLSTQLSLLAHIQCLPEAKVCKFSSVQSLRVLLVSSQACFFFHPVYVGHLSPRTERRDLEELVSRSEFFYACLHAPPLKCLLISCLTGNSLFLA